MKKLIGETEENVIVLEFRENRYFAVSGVEYDGAKYLFSDEEGERRAEQLVDDCGLWEETVASGGTEESKADWIAGFMAPGWPDVLGDVEEIEIYNDAGTWVKTLYSSWGSCGQIDSHLSPDDFTKIFIPMSDIETIFRFWKLYHLKDLSEVPGEDLEEMRRIFTPETDLSDWKPDLSELEPKCED